MKKTLRISFNGKTYEVVAEILGDDASSSAAGFAASAPAAAMAAAAAAPLASSPARTAVAAGQGEIPSPLAGKVVSIDVKVGAPVKLGQGVITLEAMKMNTVVSAQIDGTVASVHVNPGDSVEEGQLLMTLK